MRGRVDPITQKPPPEKRAAGLVMLSSCRRNALLLLVDTCPVTEFLRYRFGNRPHFTTTVSVKGTVQVSLDIAGDECLLDEDVNLLAFRDLERSRIVDLDAIAIFTFHKPHPLYMHILWHIGSRNTSGTGGAGQCCPVLTTFRMMERTLPICMPEGFLLPK